MYNNKWFFERMVSYVQDKLFLNRTQPQGGATLRLRGIEMQGFKSFAERTKLTFDDGITAVVGPNGSGKSNISDAVKWVFGEQSIKSLRGTKMEDVIFNGTQNRKPQGFTWVSLFIDNTDRSIDVDSDEVVITRKLYRSGESEYRINHNQVRLKDIHEIFMDTGLGRDGYSIIEQGKIAEIVSAKSTQRREIFEEAAGISRFRYRKGEAEHRLAQAEENLVRLRDIMGELEGRVGPLKAQSDKAQKFLVYAEEKKALEISLWLRTLDRLREQIQAQEDKILVCRSDRNGAQDHLDEIEEQIESLYRATQDCVVYIDRKRTEIKELEERSSNAQVTIAVKKNDALHNQTTIASLEEELAGSASSSSGLEEQIIQKQAELSLHDTRLEKERQELVRLEQTLGENRTAYETLSASAQALHLQREELREGMNQSKVSSETSATLVGETLQRLESLRNQAKEKDVRLSALKEELSQCRAFSQELAERLESLGNTRKGYEFKLQGKQGKMEELEAQVRSLEKSAGERLQRAQLLSDLEKNMEGFSGSVKLVMKNAASGALRGVVGPVSSLIQVEKEYSTAIEIALGASMQNIVVEDEGVAKRSISVLKDAKAGRCTFLPLTTIKGSVLQEKGLEERRGFVGVASRLVRCESRYQSIVDYQLGRVVIAEDIDSAIEIGRSYQHRFRVVTLDGQVVNAGGSLTGGYVARSASILSRKSEIEALTRQAQEFSGKAKEAETRLQALRQEMASITALMDGVDAETKTAGEDAIAAGGEVKRLTMAVEEAETLSEQALQEFDALTARVEELKTQGLTSQQLVEKLTENLQAVEEELASCAQRQETMNQELSAQSALLNQKQVSLAEAVKDREVLAAAVENLLAQREGNNTRLEEIQGQIRSLEEANTALAQEVEEITATVAGSKEAIDSLNASILEKMKERDQCEQKTNQLRQEEREVMAQKESLSGELARLEERLVGMNGECDTLTGKLWDEYELTRSQAAELAIPLEDAAASDRRLTELRNKIRNLGTVNLAAIEEYKEVSQRYEFFKTQIDDVEKSKAELGKLITNLSGQMSQIFLEKFKAINEHFGKIFTEMFGGGRGELRLTDPEDPLETGIDIFVQPSGKMVGLSLLSGGEKAIVAICIYFAILKVNPAPFVLIDEIEAALDDVNVTRFANYLRRMTDKTQFIAITHRRGTMEEADVLYGVTMEEEGVSKLLRLNVSELEEKLNLK